MALGGLAFNFVTIGPAILVGGLVAKGQGARELTKARHDEAKLETAIAEMDKLDAQLDAIQGRADELSNVLTGLTGRAVIAIDLLESESFDPRLHAERFQRAVKLAVAVKDVAAAPVLDESGELTEESARLTVKYRQMAEGNNGGSTQGE